MNSISVGATKVLNHSIQWLNRPVVKENVKNISGIITFTFGIVGSYDLFQIVRGRQISTENNLNASHWNLVANNITVFCAKLSLVLSAGVSRPGLFIISSLTGHFFSSEQLYRAFGPNTIFAVNPKHPRHIVSIAAAILAVPFMIQSALNLNAKPFNNPSDPWLTDRKLRFITLFNLITSRPTLHLGNLLLHRA